jgi:hypothetical protein
MKLRILASAKKDLEEGYRFYEAQNAGLGEYFITSVEADIESLLLYAGIHPIVYKGFHRSLCRTFPFAIYYLKSVDIAIIHAVLDCRRDPAWIRQRLQKGGAQIPTTPPA